MSLDLARVYTSKRLAITADGLAGVRAWEKGAGGISIGGFAIGIIMLSTCRVCVCVGYKVCLKISAISPRLATLLLRVPRLTLCLCIRIADRTLKEIVRVAHKTNGSPEKEG